MRKRFGLLGLLAILLLASLSLAAQAIDFVSAAGQAHQKLGLDCAGCHNTAKPTAKAPVAACLKCHGNADGRYLGKGPKRYAGDGGAIKTVNPHQSHLVDLPCGECHRIHSASVNYCNTCHLFSDMNVK